MLRGEIRLVDLDPARSGEADEQRPAVIVSNDGANTMATRLGSGVVTVIPMATNTVRVYPFQVFLPASQTGLDRDSRPKPNRSARSRSTASPERSAACHPLGVPAEARGARSPWP